MSDSVNNNLENHGENGVDVPGIIDSDHSATKSPDEDIKSVFLKKFGEILSKGAIMWYHNLAPNSIDSFAMLADSFIKAYASAIKVATRKSDVFKIKQRENEMLREFVSRFQMEQMELQPVSDNRAVQAFTQVLNERSSVASKQLK
ncbi:uncharacterized protein [Nicotiana sylvestris]|uniref:uncharacterized protein n=1 Tax=Nicotiana sylvestris TaxID=4096 RepID=UPI00388CB1AC